VSEMVMVHFADVAVPPVRCRVSSRRIHRS